MIVLTHYNSKKNVDHKILLYSEFEPGRKQKANTLPMHHDVFRVEVRKTAALIVVIVDVFLELSRKRVTHALLFYRFRMTIIRF